MDNICSSELTGSTFLFSSILLLEKVFMETVNKKIFLDFNDKILLQPERFVLYNYSEL